MTKIIVPKNFPVRPLRHNDRAKCRATCGTCGLSWDDGIATSYTPTPSARCPFEEFHKEEKRITLKYLWAVEQNYKNKGWYPLVDYIRRNRADALKLKAEKQNTFEGKTKQVLYRVRKYIPSET